MAHSDGHITSPVSFADVNATLGTSHTDLFALCTDNNINMWSKFKPIYSTKVGILTNADFQGAHIKSGYKTGGGILKPMKTGSTYLTDVNAHSDGMVSDAVWTHDKPVLGESAARLHDFNNYDHTAIRIFRITNIFGNIDYFFLPSSDSAAGFVVAFDMSFITGNMTPDFLFGDCWSTYYPAVILSCGYYSLNYVKSAPNPISAYSGGGVTIKVDTRMFMNKMKADWSASHSGDAYNSSPFKNGDKWTATLVLIDGYFDGGENDGSYKLGNGNNIVRLEYASPSGDTHVDRKTLPVEQSKFTNIEWMKMTVSITKVETKKYKISAISVKAKMLNTDSVTFVVDANLSTPQGTVNVSGVTSGNPVSVTNYSNVTFSGTTGEVTKSLSFNETTWTITATTTGNILCNGTLTFKATDGNFSGTFSFDVSGGSSSYSKEIQLL